METIEEQMIVAIIKGEIDRAIDEVIKCFNIIASLTSGDPEYAIAVDELQKAIKNLNTWKEVQRLYNEEAQAK
jgi:hypothetical protein